MIASSKSKVAKWLLYIVHCGIIINFAIEIAYASYMIFVVIAPEGGGPLMDRALTFPFEQMVTRRLYALECWVAIAGLSIYLAITEIVPRRQLMLKDKA